MDSVLCLFFLLCIFGPRSFLGWVWRESRFPSHSLDRKDPWRFYASLILLFEFWSFLVVCVITHWQLCFWHKGERRERKRGASLPGGCFKKRSLINMKKRFLLTCYVIQGAEMIRTNVCFQFGRALCSGCAQALRSIRELVKASCFQSGTK